jgi:secreted Zn-dependent insulinase-like peptidase
MCLPDDNRGVLGFSILIQSNIKNSHQLTSYVDTFVGKILKEKIDQLTEEEFNQYRDSLLSTKQQKDKKLADESLRFWSEIVKHAYEFNRKEQELEALPTITVE